MNNQAFIDAQNLYLGTTKAKSPWKIDLFRFRIYLREKYKVEKAYYFLGAVSDDQWKLYETIQSAGFILCFRKHNQSMIGKKKGNVDTDIVFTIMEKIAEREKFNKVVLVSGDGDYWRMVEYLIAKKRFAKLLVPNKKSMSSLYKQWTADIFRDYLDDDSVKRKIAHAKKK